MRVVLALLLAVAATVPVRAQAGPPVHLRVEGRVDPGCVDALRPRLAFVAVDARRGAAPTGAQVLVAGSAEELARGSGDLWDSGRIAWSGGAPVEYGGAPLRSRQRCFWRVRTFDAGGVPSPWSATATWTMGLLDPADWSAQWIGDPEAAPPLQAARNGYHSELRREVEREHRLSLDLGRAIEVDGVRLHPARPYDWRDTPGFLFPLRYRVALAGEDGAAAVVVVDRGAADEPGPGTQAVTLRFPRARARRVELTTLRQRARRAGEHGVALAELEVLQGDRVVSAGAAVRASDSIETEAWSTRFLVDGDLVSHGVRGADAAPAPLLRKVFDAPAGVRHARLHVAALGLHETRLNGAPVSPAALAPSWVDYGVRIPYQTLDVTGLLRAGRNELEVQLADGWYAGRLGMAATLVPGGPPRGIYGRQPRLLLQLELERAGGSTVRVVSDGSWSSTLQGPVRRADLLDGTELDLRRMPGPEAWRPVRVFPAPAARLVAQVEEPIVVTERVPVRARTRSPDGEWIHDFGQNLVGRVRGLVPGTPVSVTLRHGEALDAEGRLYTANLRGAPQRDILHLVPGIAATVAPPFTFHGFRYLAVPDSAPFEPLYAEVLHSDVARAGAFACSDPRLTRLWQNADWSLRGNLLGVPTDCPQRDERLGWMGDLLVFAPTAMLQRDLRALLDKWLRDVRDAQAADGRLPDFAPHPYGKDERFTGTPGWGDAGVFVPWAAYVHYGDARFLADAFPSASRWVDWIASHNPDRLWRHRRGNDYGDWLNGDSLDLPGWPRRGGEVAKELFATAFFARSAELVGRMARALGRQAEAERYARLHQDVRAAFQRAYVAADGVVQGDTQAGYALALAFDLVPPALVPRVVERMVAAIDAYGGRLSTGFHATIPLLDQLVGHGHADLAWRLLLREDVPGWLHAVNQGATTMWERWDGFVPGRGFQDAGMNSFNHYAYGAVGEWLFAHALGVRPDAGHPGFARFRVAPRLWGGVHWAQGHVDTVRGRIAVAWRRSGTAWELDLVVPPGAVADLHLPATGVDAAREGGLPLVQGRGVRVVETGPGTVRCEVQAGRYAFSTVLPAPTPARQAGPARAVQAAEFEWRRHRGPRDQELPYRLLRPRSVAEGARYPLLLFLHGAGERGQDNHRQLIHLLPTPLLQDEGRTRFPCFVVAPQCPKDQLWVEVDWSKGGAMPAGPSPALRMVLELLDRLAEELPIDLGRVYVTGLSMGGYGTFDLACRAPERFAAAVPVCGGGDPTQAERLRALPLWVFHSADDRTVPVERSRAMVEALRGLGAAPRYTEFRDAGHASWRPAYADPELWTWLFAQRRG
ncbi:MAG: family 78 glycoside hydrolase catalytic domain [Planctomycetes bacterium]|nr:family 78 glycoside hydrolase catalytic domain [Planctomycetota bacterium]